MTDDLSKLSADELIDRALQLQGALIRDLRQKAAQAAQEPAGRDDSPTPPPTDSQDTPDASQRRLRNLAESHAHEAHRLAGTQAGNTHAQIALVYATLAGQEKRP